MIELQLATPETPLTADDTKQMNNDLTKQYNDIVGRLLTTDLPYIEDDVESPCKDEPELEEDIANVDTAPLELEDMHDMPEELTPCPDAPAIETTSILSLPRMSAEDVSPVRRVPVRRRRSEDQDEHNVNPADAGESDAVMTYLREIGRVPMITHDREIELAKRIEAGDRDAMKQFILANLRLVVSIAKR